MADSKPQSAGNIHCRFSRADPARMMRLYGWDSRNEAWHGPNEFGAGNLADRRLLRALQTAPSTSWFGPVNCRTPGEPEGKFFVLVNDLSDCAVASIYCNESKAGPAEILAVIPASRRPRLRPEFAFEFLAYARFLGSLSAGAEMQVHDAIVSAIAEDRDSRALVFSINSGLWPGDLDHVLARSVEKVAVALCQWLEEPAARDRSSVTAA